MQLSQSYDSPIIRCRVTEFNSLKANIDFFRGYQKEGTQATGRSTDSIHGHNSVEQKRTAIITKGILNGIMENCID